MINDFLEFEFLRHAVFAALLGSVACGLVGPFVITKRIVSITGSLAHCAFGGIGLGIFLSIDPMLTIVPFCLACALLMGILSKKSNIPQDTLTGIFWSVCMAAGVVLIGFSKGYTPDLFSYLFGNILTVSKADINAMLVLNVFIILCIAFLYKDLLAMTFDEEYARISGLPTMFLYLLLLCIVAFTIVILIQMVGIILVIALIAIPATIAKQWTFSLKKMMLLSIAIGVVFCLSGLWVSYNYNLASGASIILISALGFLASNLIKR